MRVIKSRSDKIRGYIATIIASLFIMQGARAEINNNAPHYSESKKQSSVQNLSKMTNKSQLDALKSANNYNKGVFNAVRDTYGGYEDADIVFDEKDKDLTDAEKRSILNTKRNASIIKEELKGFRWFH